VYPVWCVRGRQEVTLDRQGGGHPVVVRRLWQSRCPLAVEGERLTVPGSDTPVYVTGTTIEGVAERKPVEEKTDGRQPLVDFDKAGMLDVVPSASQILEHNWDYPRIKGTYAVDFVQEDGAQRGQD